MNRTDKLELYKVKYPSFAKKNKIPMLFVAETLKQTEKAIYIHGKGTLTKNKLGLCSICGKTLTNPNSIELGIGPICADKYGIKLLSEYTNKDIEKELHKIEFMKWVPKSCLDILGIKNADFIPVFEKKIQTHNQTTKSPEIEDLQAKKAIKQGDLLYITFPFDISTLTSIKTLSGRRFKKEPKPHWECPDTLENRLQLQERGFDVPKDKKNKNENENKEETKIPNFPSHLDKILFPYQKEGVRFLFEKQGRALIGDDMGCIAGDMIINYNRGGRSRKITLEKLYNRTRKKGRYSWDKNIPTYIRSLKGNIFGLHKLKKVLYKGKKETIRITTESGKTIILTPDHELLNKHKEWVQASDFKIGDIILTNGKPKCKKCGTSKNIIKYKYAKFKGYCKSCMYLELRKNQNQYKSKKKIHSDGYIYLTGSDYHGHDRYTSSGLLEHVYLMEKRIGRPLKRNEQVHHKNKIRHDNRIKNLKLVTISKHAKIHKTHIRFHDAKTKAGNDIILIPKKEKIIKIEKTGIKKVYDIIMDDPYRNFVANEIIVHNCGKTIQSLVYSYMEPKIKKVLIICPASLKLNWGSEISKWLSDFDLYILNGKPNGEKKQKIDFSKFKIISNKNAKKEYFVINYDIIGNKETKQRGKKKPVEYLYTGWIDYLIDYEFDLVIGDEIHFIKNHTTQRSKAVTKIGKIVKRFVPMSGTPIINRPIEFWTCLNTLDSGLFNSYWNYAKKYCGAKHNGYGWDFNGASNTRQLHEIIKTIMIRRKKEDVLKELPPKLKSVVPLEIDNRTTYTKAEKDLIAFLRNEYGEDKAEKAKSAEALVRIETLKQLIIKGKKKACLEWISDYLDTNDKLIVFGIHKETLDFVHNKFKGISVRIDGSTKNEDRQKAVDSFQNNPDIKLFIGNIKAAGVGLTLTAANGVCFLEFGWTPGEHDQAEDRPHRIGQKNTVNIYYLIGESTIEVDIMNMLDEKRNVINSILDGKTEKEVSFIDMLLKKINKEK